MVRQSLIGGDYGMIDRFTMKPRPDFWISWLWRRLMGSTAHAVSSSREGVRVYLHDHPSGKGMTLLLINLCYYAVEVDLEGFGSVTGRYTLTAKRPTSRKIRINGVKPAFRQGRVRLEDFAQEGARCLPAQSISFWTCASGKS